jgi:glycosyltransferase involved in cell wall biosynthesis
MYGGAERQIVELANHLTDKNYKVAVFSTHIIPEFKKNLKEARIIETADMENLVNAIKQVEHKFEIVNPHNHPAELFFYKTKAKSVWQCIPSNSIVYTSNGVEYINNICSYDKLWNNEVSNTFVRDANEQIYCIKPRYLEKQYITKEHPIAIAKFSKENNKWNKKYEQWINPKDIQNKTLKTQYCVIVPKYDNTIGIKHFVNLNDYAKNKKIYYNGEITKDICELIGWYSAEGYAEEHRVKFCLNYNEIEYQNRIINILKSIGISSTIHEYKEHSSRIIYVSCTPLARFLKSIVGNNAKHKVVPSFMFSESKENKEAYVNALRYGDGDINIRKRKYKDSIMYRIVSSSELLIKGLQRILFSIGIVAGCYHKKQTLSYINGNAINGTILYYLYWTINGNYKKYFEDDNNYYLPIDKISTVDYKGKLFNLETTTHNYCIPFIVHNCNEPPNAVLTGNKLDDREVEAVRETINKIVVISDFEKKRCKSVYGIDPILNYPAVRYEYFDNPPLQVKPIFGKDNIVILQTGYFTWTKNQVKTIETFADILHEYPSARLILAGFDKDPYSNEIRKKVDELGLRDYVKIFPYLETDEEFKNLYYQADLFLNPVYEQGGWATTFESIVSGVPTLVSNKFVGYNLVKNQELGKVASFDNFSKTALDMIANINREKEIVNANKVWLKDNLTWKAFGERYEKIFESM